MIPVLVSSEPWDIVWRRNQQLAARIPGTIFIEPAHPGLRSRRREEGQVTVINPPKPVPLRIRGGAEIGARIAARAIRNVADGDPVLWLTHPYQAHLARIVGCPIVYDRTDDWPRMETAPSAAREVAKLEDWVLANSDAVVIVSEAMRGQVPAGATLIANGVDYARFAGPKHPRKDGAFRIGFAGTLETVRIDVEMLTELAAGSEVELLLVGPGDLPVKAVKTGPVPHADVPELLLSCDALVAPYREDVDLNRTVDSLKLYEYFATGLPVIATMTAGYERYRDLVIAWPLARDLRGASADNANLAEGRRAVARQSDWSLRADAMGSQLAAAAAARVRQAAL
jgi:glycosyltransferase involved in cell wall biosynthesis